MRISVIMGAFNVEKTVARAIDSIVAQTFTDWIFVICDDGSTDRTMDVLQQYKTKYPEKIIILSNGKNRGLTYTLNHCLEYADSEYVARMDADDISLPQRFEREVNFLDSNPEYAFVGCAIERFDEKGVWAKGRISTSSPTKDVFYKSSGFVHPTTLIRKCALNDVGGYREAWFTNRCEDYDLWMRMYAKGYKGYNINEILFQYYEGKDSFPKRKYKYRIGESVMRAKGYATLGMFPKGFLYLFKPLIAGLIPKLVFKKLRSK